MIAAGVWTRSCLPKIDVQLTAHGIRVCIIDYDRKPIGGDDEEQAVPASSGEEDIDGDLQKGPVPQRGFQTHPVKVITIRLHEGVSMYITYIVYGSVLMVTTLVKCICPIDLV